MTKPIRLLALLAATALLGVSSPVLAEQIQFTANLTGGAETPPNDSPGNGTADATFDTDTNMLTYSITYAGLTGDATAAHFHGPADVGEKAPPSLPIAGNLTSPITASVAISDQQEAELEAGKWYFNLHTAKYPDGELRGQMLQVGGSSAMENDSSMMSDSSSMASDGGMSSSMSDGGTSSASANGSSSGADASVSVDVSASGEVLASVNPSSIDISTSVDVSASTGVSVSASTP